MENLKIFKQNHATRALHLKPFDLVAILQVVLESVDCFEARVKIGTRIRKAWYVTEIEVCHISLR